MAVIEATFASRVSRRTHRTVPPRVRFMFEVVRGVQARMRC